MSNIKAKTKTEKIYFVLPAMTAFVEATAGIIRFTTPEKIRKIK